MDNDGYSKKVIHLLIVIKTMTLQEIKEAQDSKVKQDKQATTLSQYIIYSSDKLQTKINGFRSLVRYEHT